MMTEDWQHEAVPLIWRVLVRPMHNGDIVIVGENGSADSAVELIVPHAYVAKFVDKVRQGAERAATMREVHVGSKT